MAREGEGRLQDFDLACSALRSAAEAGLPEAEYALSREYRTGQIVSKDGGESIRWLASAADKGYVPALLELGKACEAGMDLPQDYVSAHMWYNLAATLASRAEGNEEAKAEAMLARDRLTRKMTREQVAEAQKRARDWLAAH